MKLRKKHIIVALVFLFSTGMMTFSESETAYANFEGYQQRCVIGSSGSESEEDSSDSSSSSSPSSARGESGGNWEEEGTEANKIAQEIWDYWKDKGFSGASIAGVMGNVAHEGGFDIPDRAEGYNGGSSESDGISEGNEPQTGAGYSVGGAGHYQFTPFTKFAEIGDDKWKDTKAQSDYVWSSEVEGANWLDEYIELDSPEEATEMWFQKYERGQQLAPEKADSAKKAYEVFGGSDVSADSALASAVDTADDGKEEEETKQDPCSPKNENKKSKGSNGDADEILEYTSDLEGYFTYAQSHGEDYIGSVDSPDKSGITDCSGYIWLVLAQAGYNVPDDMQWFTQSMEDDAKGDNEYFEEVDEDDAGAGDVVIVNTGDGAGSNGHTAFLLEDWKDEPLEENSTEISQMGGDKSATGVNERPFYYGFTSLVQDDHSISFARPVEK